MSENEPSGSQNTALVPADESRETVLRSVIALWAGARTGEMAVRRIEHVRKKSETVTAFFSFIKKKPSEVDERDVRAWAVKI